ncbi:MAG: DUF4214 domain-containing protein, partial [Pyrinomonadaceae bacterium]
MIRPHKHSHNSIAPGHSSRRRRKHPLIKLTILLTLVGIALAGLSSFLSRPSKAASLTVVISQFYVRSGTATSLYNQDFVELHNQTNASINLANASLQYIDDIGMDRKINLSGTIGAGKYYLISIGAVSTGVSSLPTPDATGPTGAGRDLNNADGTIALFNCTVDQTIATTCPTNVMGACSVIDKVGYASTGTPTSPPTCPEGTATQFPNRLNSRNRGVTGNNPDTDDNSVDFTLSAPNPRNTATAATGPTAAEAAIRGLIADSNGDGVAGVAVNLSGSKSIRAITDSQGRYSFTGLDAAGFYTVTPQLANYNFGPASRSFSLLSDQADAPFTATASAQTANPLDTSEYFVRQQYLDFLDREPDAEGFNYWSSQFDSCGVDNLCLNSRRIDTSAAFFMEREFQLTGSFVYGLYKGSLGRNPQFAEFMPDRSRISAGDQLDSSKQALADEWVTRSEFKRQYPDSMTNAEFVNRLFDVAGLSGYSSERQGYINALNSGGTRSAVVRGVIEGDAFMQK